MSLPDAVTAAAAAEGEQHERDDDQLPHLTTSATATGSSAGTDVDCAPGIEPRLRPGGKSTHAENRGDVFDQRPPAAAVAGVAEEDEFIAAAAQARHAEVHGDVVRMAAEVEAADTRERITARRRWEDRPLRDARHQHQVERHRTGERLVGIGLDLDDLVPSGGCGAYGRDDDIGGCHRRDDRGDNRAGEHGECKSLAQSLTLRGGARGPSLPHRGKEGEHGSLAADRPLPRKLTARRRYWTSRRRDNLRAARALAETDALLDQASALTA